MIKALFILVALIGAFFGAYSGSRGTSLAWRRYGIPALFVLSALIVLKSFWVIFLMSICGVLSIGYGVPDETDEGSTIGAFWYKVTKKNHLMTDVLMRGTVGVMMSVAFLVIPILKGNWLIYGVGSLGIILTYIVWGAFVQGEGSFEVGDVEFLVEDIIIYLSLMFFGLTVIYF